MTERTLPLLRICRKRHARRGASACSVGLGLHHQPPAERALSSRTQQCHCSHRQISRPTAIRSLYTHSARLRVARAGRIWCSAPAQLGPQRGGRPVALPAACTACAQCACTWTYYRPPFAKHSSGRAQTDRAYVCCARRHEPRCSRAGGLRAALLRTCARAYARPFAWRRCKPLSGTAHAPKARRCVCVCVCV